MTYLRCSDNNRARTVLTWFVQAVEDNGVPSRIRCDLGIENVDIARFMLVTRGTGRHSVLSGSSTHNQRIERLWRDVHRVVIRQFKNLFSYLEEYSFLNPLNDLHLFALHYVFIPRINRALDEFTRQYNHHPIRTEQNMTPVQLNAMRYPLPAPLPVTSLNNYGIEEDGPVPDIESPDNVVLVDPPAFTISQPVEAMLPDPLYTDGMYGILVYHQVLSIIERRT